MRYRIHLLFIKSVDTKIRNAKIINKVRIFFSHEEERFILQKTNGGILTEKKNPKPSGFAGFSLKKGNSSSQKVQPKNSAFGINEEDDDIKEVKIDTFDKESGAYDEKTGPTKPKQPLVITNAGNDDWKRIAKERFNPQITTKNVETSKKLEFGINFIESKNQNQDKMKTSLLLKKKDIDNFKNDVSSRPDIATLEEYEEIPVEDFGAAMLRGMGWKEEDDKDKTNTTGKAKNIQRSQYLGLGAKELPGSNVTEKYYNPVRKIDRTTGETVKEDRDRDRSPNRINNYKSTT